MSWARAETKGGRPSRTAHGTCNSPRPGAFVAGYGTPVTDALRASGMPFGSLLLAPRSERPSTGALRAPSRRSAEGPAVRLRRCRVRGEPAVALGVDAAPQTGFGRGNAQAVTLLAWRRGPRRADYVIRTEGLIGCCADEDARTESPAIRRHAPRLRH